MQCSLNPHALSVVLAQTTDTARETRSHASGSRSSRGLLQCKMIWVKHVSRLRATAVAVIAVKRRVRFSG